MFSFNEFENSFAKIRDLLSVHFEGYGKIILRLFLHETRFAVIILYSPSPSLHPTQNYWIIINMRFYVLQIFNILYL